MSTRGKQAGDRAKDHYSDRFAELATDPARIPSWLDARRREAMASFAELGFPDRRQEAWRYTNVAAVASVPFELAEPGGELSPDEITRLAGLDMPGGEIWRAVFVNGSLARELSQLPGAGDSVTLTSLAEALCSQNQALTDLLSQHLTRLADIKSDGFTALNTAFISDGAIVEVAAGERAARPLHLVFVTRDEGHVVHPRILIVAGESSQATVITDYVSLSREGSSTDPIASESSAACLTNSVCEVRLEANAGLDLLLCQREGQDDAHISNLQVEQARDSRFRSHTLCLDGRLLRNELSCVLADSGTEAELRGLFLCSDEQHVDNHTLVDHAMPNCTSNELYKGVLAGRSQGVFRGRVIVRPDAQKTDARQSNPNLLLSDRAEIDTLPQLEIYADDVRCSHGATIGALDSEALFYLQSRGVAEDTARALLTRGFANEVTADLSEPELVEWTQTLIEQSLQQIIAAEPGEER